MSVIFLLLWFISLILLVLGLINPALIQPLTKRKLTRKQSGLLFGGLAIIFPILMAATVSPEQLQTKPSQQVSGEKKSVSEASQSAEAALAKANQAKEDYKLFYKKYKDITSQSEVLNNKINDDVASSSQGKMSTAALFLEVKDAVETQNILNMKMQDIHTSDYPGLASYKDDLITITGRTSDGLYARKLAMTTLADLLNTNNLEKMSQFKDNVQLSTEWFNEATIKLIALEQKIGIKAEDLTK